MSLEAKTRGLQIFYEQKKQRNKEENTRREGRELCYLSQNVLKNFCRPYLVSNPISSSTSFWEDCVVAYISFANPLR
jgi:hypothetical protein